MASTINATTSSGIVATAENTGQLQLQTTGTTAVTIDASQNVGIGVTPQTWYTGKALQLGSYSAISDLSTSTRINNNAYYNAAGSATYINTAAATEYASGGGTHYWKYAASGTAGTAITWTNVLYITTQGYLHSPPTYSNTTGAAANLVIEASGQFVKSTSALKYKTDVRNLESIDINKFRPVRYKSKCANDDKTKDFIGIIADEVDAAGIKELVTYNPDGEVEGFQYERLTAVLVKTVQEQQITINDLKARIETLEAK